MIPSGVLRLGAQRTAAGKLTVDYTGAVDDLKLWTGFPDQAVLIYF